MTGPVIRDDPEGRPVPGMGADVFFPVPDAESFAAAARQWLGELPGLLAPEAWQDVLRAGKPPFRGAGELRWPEYDEWEEPFTAWGTITVAPLKWNGMRIWHRRVRRSSLQWLAEVLADRPVSARIWIGRVDARGIHLPGGVGISAESGLGRPGELIPAGRLGAHDSLMWRPGARLEDTAELRERLAGVARDWAARPGIQGVLAGQDGAADMELPFSGPPVHWEDAMLERELLAYSWLTLCPPGPSERLGGAPALRASGAFWRVKELADGAVLLQATERPDEYGPAAAERVHEALAAVLPDWLALLRTGGCELRPGADARAIGSAEAAAGQRFPGGLRSLYLASDGAFDADGQWWVIWPLEMLARENEQRRRAGLLPGSLLAFGDDGAGNAFCVEPGSPGVICWHPVYDWKQPLAHDLPAFWRGWTQGTITT